MHTRIRSATQEFVFHHTLDNLARELENLDLLIEEGFCDSKDEVDRFLTHSQLNHNLSTDFHKTADESQLGFTRAH